MKRTLFILAVMITLSTPHAAHAQAENPLPDRFSVEIKFLLDPAQVLCEDGTPRQDMRDMFNTALPWVGEPIHTMDEPNRTTQVQFMDTTTQDFSAAGWFNRIRYRDDLQVLQLTYRYRLPLVFDTCLTMEDVYIAYSRLFEAGFDVWFSVMGIHEVLELDWSYDSAVLTASYTVNIPWERGFDMPCKYEARILLAENIPHEMMAGLDFVDICWYLALLQDSVLHGPETSTRYRTRGIISAAESHALFGIHRSTRVDLDVFVMSLGDRFVVELSSSVEIRSRGNPQDWVNFDHVTALRSVLHDIAADAGILLHESGLKTAQLLEYHHTPPGSTRPICRSALQEVISQIRSLINKRVDKVFVGCD